VRVCVAVPPVRDYYFTSRRFSALGAKTVCKLLETAGHQLSFFNFPVQAKKGRGISPPDGMEHLREFAMPQERGPLTFFTRYQHFGPSFAACAQEVIAKEPELVLLSSFAFAYADQALELAKEIKTRRAEVTIVVGGAGATAFPEYYLGRNGLGIDSIDLAVVGEAEGAVVEFVDRLEQGIDLDGLPGLCEGKGGLCAHTPERTEPEDLEFIWNVSLETSKNLHISTSLSRGCPRKCRFCSNFMAHGRQFRTVPLERVAAGLKGLPSHKPIVLNFEDDNLLLAREYWLEILDLCRAQFPEITFRAENGLDYGLLDEKIVDELIDRGMERFDLSLGSADLDVLKTERRHGDLERLGRVVRRAAARDIPVVTYFICGLEGDTVDTVLGTLLFLTQLPTQVGISLFYPVPGLPGFTDEKMFENRPSALCAGSAAWPWTGSLSSAQLVTAFRLARFVNLCKKEALSPEERELVERCRMETRLYTWIGKERRYVPAPGVDEEMAAAFLGALPTSETTARIEHRARLES